MRISLNVAMIMLAIVFMTACTPESGQDPAVEAMRSAAEAEDRMQATIDTMIKAWDTGDTDMLDAIVAPGIQRTSPDRNASGLADYKDVIAEVHRVYPDFSISNDGAAVGPDGGFVQWTVSGTDSGTDGATGNTVTTTGITRYQIEDGKVTRELVVFDTGSVLTQLQREELPRSRQ